VRFVYWYLTIGGLLVVMAIAGSILKRLPLTASIFYMVVSAGLGPPGAGLLQIDILRDAHLLERLTEVAVIVSLFTAGLKLRLPWSDRCWRPPVLLASVAIVLVIGALLAAVSWRSLPLWSFAVLLLAIRPAATFLSLPGTKTTIGQRLLIAWFWVRGIPSIREPRA
jgi:NhaP-type Na+/H+ or K+/H+ antiporter